MEGKTFPWTRALEAAVRARQVRISLVRHEDACLSRGKEWNLKAIEKESKQMKPQWLERDGQSLHSVKSLCSDEKLEVVG